MKHVSPTLPISKSFASIAVVVLVGLGCSRPDSSESGLIQIKGSDTMVHVMSLLAESYMASHPGTSIAITGGGSGTGISALLNGTADTCMSSREISDEERELAQQRGLTPQEHAIGLDGIALIVHPANPLDALTIPQIRQIYTGEVTQWNEIGGHDGQVIAYSRESNSGTYVYFREHLLGGSDFTPSARLLPSTTSIIQSVSQDEAAIGYVGLGYAAGAGRSVKMIGVAQSDDASPVVPDADNVRSGVYAISRPLYLYTAGDASPGVKGFLDFCLSAEGQRLLEEAGYVSQM